MNDNFYIFSTNRYLVLKKFLLHTIKISLQNMLFYQRVEVCTCFFRICCSYGRMPLVNCCLIIKSHNFAINYSKCFVVENM